MTASVPIGLMFADDSECSGVFYVDANCPRAELLRQLTLYTAPGKTPGQAMIHFIRWHGNLADLGAKVLNYGPAHNIHDIRFDVASGVIRADELTVVDPKDWKPVVL